MQGFLYAGPFTASDGDGRQLFEDVEIRLDEGEAVVLDGPSGSGKSRLLRHVVALDAALGSTRSLAGESYAGRALPRWRSRVTLLAQDAPVVPGTIGDNLALPFRLGAAGGRDVDRERARDLMAAAGLVRIGFEREVGTLSGGERHRLALIRGLLWDPPVLMADEPFSGLDSDSAHACFDLLLRFARRDGHALVVVSHDPDLARTADRRLRLSSGRLGET